MTNRNRKGGLLRGVVLLFLLSVALGRICLVSAEKPQAPLALTLQNLPLADGQVQLILSARARLNADSVTLSLELPPSVTRVDDAVHTWSGPLAKDEAKTVTLLVRGSPEAIDQVVGRAEVKAESIGTFVQEVRHSWPPTTDLPIEPVPFVTHDGDDPILEYSGD